jgi:hypothetical protein
VGRNRKPHPKRNSYCLRLTDKQKTLLRRYTEFRDYTSEVDAVRGMIDGLEGWLQRQMIKPKSAPNDNSGLPTKMTNSGLPIKELNSGLPSPTDVEDGASVGDFAGRASVGLPKPRHNDD